MGFFSFISAPFKAVAKVVSWVGDAVADVVEFAVEEIFEPVIDVVGGIVEGMISDPLTTIATIVAFATGNAWAIPIIQGASTAAHGGDLGDIAKAVAISYIAQRAGPYVGEYASGVAGDLGASAATQQVVAQVAQQATSSAIRAVAAGGDAGDILKAAATGAVTAGVAAGLEYAVDHYTPTITGEGAETALGFNVNAAALEKFTDVSNSIGIELGDITGAYSALPETVRNIITSGAAASVTSLATTGEIDKDQVAGAIARAVTTTNLTANTLDKIPGIIPRHAAILSKVASDVVASAYADVDPYEAYRASLTAATLEDLFIKVDDVTLGGIGKAIDAISGAGAEAKTKLETADNKRSLVNNSLIAYEAKRTELNSAIEKYKNDVEHYNTTLRHGNQGVAETFRANNIDAFVDGKYAVLQNELAALKIDYDSAYNGFQTASNEYTLAREALFTNEKYLEEVIAPVRQDFTKDVVTAITTNPDTGVSEFNEDEYREIYGLSPSDSPQEHWLVHNRQLAVSQRDLEQKVENDILTSSAYQNNRSLFTDDAGEENIKKLRDDIIKLGSDDSIGFQTNVLERRGTIENFIPDWISEAQRDGTLDLAAIAPEPGRDEGVRDEQIANGEAYLATRTNPDTGNKVWGWTTKPNISENIFNPATNEWGTYIYEPAAVEEGDYGRVAWRGHGEEGSRGDWTGANLNLETGIVEWVAPGAPFEEFLPGTAPVYAAWGNAVMPPPVPMTLQTVARVEPLIAIDSAGKLKLDEDQYAKLNWLDRQLVDYSIKVYESTEDMEDNPKKYGDVVGDWTSGDTDRYKKNASVALSAGGELLQAFNGIVHYVHWFGAGEEIGKYAENTSAGIAAAAILDISKATQPEDYAKVIDNFHKEWGATKGYLEPAEFFVDALFDSEYREVILREILAKEILQEIPLIVASLGTGTLANFGVKALAKGGNFAADTARDIASKWGRRVGVSTEISLQVVETAGATANETFNTVYDELIAGGWDEQEATIKANEAGVTSGIIAASVEGTVGRILDPTDRVVGRLMRGRAGRIANELAETSGSLIVGVGLEGVSEATEELLALQFTVETLRELVPNSPSFDAGGRFSGENYEALQMITGITAAAAGVGTAGAISTGTRLIDVLPNGEPRPITSAPAGTPPSYVPFDTGNPVGNILVNINPTINAAMNDAQSEDSVLREEGVQALKNAFSWDALPPVDMVQDEEGVWTEAPAVHTTALALLNTAAPGQFNTSSEVERAFELNETPYVPTPEDIYTFTGETPAAELSPSIEEHIDPRYTDEGEIETGFAELGYTPTTEEVSERVGQTVETETIGEIAPYVDPRQTTADEISKLYAQLGYTPSSEDITQFVGQGGPEFETETGTQIAPYVDPRQTIRSEVEEFFRTEGYTPTEAELTEYIAQGGPEFETETGRAVAERYDPLAVISPEVEEAYREAGFEGFIPSDVERFTGQYPETELGGRVQEYMPVATYNSIANILGKRGQDVTQTDVDFVVDLVAQQEVLTEADTALQPLTSQQLAYDVTGDNVIDINDQIMLEQVMTGAVPQTDIATQSPFAATGIQAQLQQQTAVQNQIQNQIAAQTQAQAEQRRMQAQNQYLAQLMETTPTTVKTPPPAEIKYVYDPFGESIFATPQQEALFGGLSPFPSSTVPTGNAPFTLPMQTVSGGGIIEDKTDEILRALGDNK